MTTVVRLLLPGRPPAISWLVIAIGIWIAVNRWPIYWPFAHIRKKSLEGIYPSITHPNPATAVVFEFLALWIATPILDGLPSSILNRPASSRMTVSSSSRSGCVNAQTPTTARQSCLQTARNDSGGIATIAFAQPLSFAITAPDAPDYRQATKTRSR